MSVIGSRIASGNDMPRFTLKMFSGPSMGAEISLGEGEYLIGRDVRSDLILNDRMIAARHLRLRVSDKGVTVTPLAMPVYVDGKLIPKEERRIMNYQVITLGTTHFALGPPEAAWPVIGLPTIKEVASSANVEQEQDNPDIGHGGHSKIARLAATHRWLKWLVIGWLGLVLLLLLTTIGSFGTVDQKDGVSAQTLETIIAKAGLDDQLQVVEDDRGRFEISGYLGDEADRVRLEKMLAARGIDVPMMIWNPATLADSARSILAAVGIRHVTVWPGRGKVPGELVMSGYIADEAGWKRALTMLREDIPGIAALDVDAVEEIESRAKVLRALIVEKELADNLKVVIENGTLSVRGALLTEGDRMRWEALVRGYERRYLDAPELIEQPAGMKKRLYIPIRSMSIGDVSYIVTRDGRKYMEGSYIGEGYVIKKIFTDRMLLEKDGATVEYLLEE